MRQIWNLVKISPTASLRNLPKLKEGFFYVLAVENYWSSNPSRALRDNLEVMAKDLGDNVLIILEDIATRNKVREVFGTNMLLEPVLIITREPPMHWVENISASDDGIKLALGGLDYDSTVRVLMQLSRLLNNPDDKIFRKLDWTARVERIKSVVKKVPVLSILSTFAGIALG